MRPQAQCGPAEYEMGYSFSMYRLAQSPSPRLTSTWNMTVPCRPLGSNPGKPASRGGAHARSGVDSALVWVQVGSIGGGADAA